MRILVTGGLGVNGAWVARRLVDEGHHVTVADLARGVADYVESLRRLDLQPTAQESESSWSTGSALPGAGPSST